LMDRVAEVRATFDGLGREVPRDIERRLLADINAARRSRRALMSEIDNINAEVGERVGGLGTPEAHTTPRHGGGGGGDPTVTTVDFNRLALDRDREILSARLALVTEENGAMLDAELAYQERVAQAQRDAADRELDLQAELNQALADAENQHQERMAEGRLAIKENQEADDEAALERRRGAAGEMMGLLGDTTSMLGDSLKAIALGTSTAEEAFTGLAKAFLEMISQYATLKAATEFADAGASFARYDYAGGAGHVAAGIAFTAVAVATGIGAGAIGSAPAAPAKPESSRSGGDSGPRGDVVINWNSPVVTATTRAELGRDMASMIGEAASI
jgi:hypothetical protein